MTFLFESPRRRAQVALLARQPKRLCGLEVDHELELGGQHDRKIARLLALENPPRINARLAMRNGKAGPVAHQAAGRRKLARIVDRGHGMARRQCDQLITLTDEKRIGANDQGSGSLLDQRREGRIEIGF
jgi:hypothetical protein